MDRSRPSSPKKLRDARYQPAYDGDQGLWGWRHSGYTSADIGRPILGAAPASQQMLMTPPRGQLTPASPRSFYSPPTPRECSSVAQSPATRRLFGGSLPQSPFAPQPYAGAPMTPPRRGLGPFEKSLPQSAPAGRKHNASRGTNPRAHSRALFTQLSPFGASLGAPSPGAACSSVSSLESLGPLCAYCRSINKPFVGHDNKNCPVLQSMRPCENCGASGKDNHTLIHCPNKPKEVLRLKPGFFEANMPGDGDDADHLFGKL